MKQDFINLLACPNSQDDLVLNGTELFTQQTSYPLFNDIPWLFKDPEYYFLEWGTKIDLFIKEEKDYIKYLQNMINTQTSKLTRQRLSHIHTAKTKNLKYITKILHDLQGQQQIALPHSNQQIHSYFELIFRDWCGDSPENKTYYNFVQKQITETTKNVLILGAGGGRLSYDLAKNNPAINFLSFDHNPLLFFTANKILKGEEVKLTQYTSYPKTIDLTVKAHKIKFDKLEHNNHQFILGTFPYLPFKQKSFDLIIAPWFFDIIDRDFKTSLKYTLNYLKPAGKLAIYGPANIHAKDIIDQLTAQEITEHLASFCDGIELTTNELTYLQNNMTSQNRLEEIMFLTGTLKNEINLNQSLPAKKESRLRFTPPFENYKAVNETFYHILKHITDDLTSAELAQIMIKEFSFKEDEAQFYAENFINKIQSEI